jgi:5-methylcytosine-specific restriction endonuclease McrA
MPFMEITQRRVFMSGKSHQPKKHITYVCMNCNKEYHPKEVDRNKFCSRECAFEFKKAKPKEIAKPVCTVCGKKFEGRADSKYCSDECFKEVSRIKGREYYRTYKAAAIVNEHREITCKECGHKFITNIRAGVKEYCSIKCAKKQEKEEYKQYRKEQMKRAFVMPVYFSKIYKRDKGICQICGQHVAYDKSPEDPMGATIDHIIPLSRGGKHHPDNCQLAHRRCNSVKGTAMPEEVVASR